MNEELIVGATEDIIETTVEEVVEGEVKIEDIEQSIDIQETVETVEVEVVEEITVEMDEAVGWVGGDSTRHYSLYGRDEPKQHPIIAIEGLREELDDIKSLGVVFSNEKNQADYYLWEDENPVQEMRAGLFVTLCNDTSKIRICTEADDIFGVTADTAAFVGGQDDIARDYKYGLVVYCGIAAVKCWSDVEVGDYVIPCNHGHARKSDTGYGYRVFALEKIHDETYAVISLDIPGNIIHSLSSEVNDLGVRMYSAEANISAAMNVANEAYNKAGEIGQVSEEAIKNALEALGKAESSEGKVDTFLDETAPNISEMAAQAKAIAESAAASAETMRDAAVVAANDALTKAGEIEKTVEPISKWEYTNPVTGEAHKGATYFAEYVKDGLSTKAEMETVSKLDTENKLLIEQNADNYMRILSSVDKYSVGEYSQAYGLTREQAKEILELGYIYIPTANHGKCCDTHPEVDTHCETFIGETEPNEFTPGNYYEWDGADWIEYGGRNVWISAEIPSNGTEQYKYWYINSNESPENYEAHALYIWKDGEWTKVNILAGNANNRVSSMIRQTAESVALEVANARESVASIEARLTDAESEVQTTASWVKGQAEDGETLYNLATIRQGANDDGANLALVVADQDGNKVLNGASIVLNNDENGSSICLDADYINFDTGTFQLDADYINLDGYATINDGFSVDTNGYMHATGGTIAGWTIAKKDSNSNTYSGGIYNDVSGYRVGIKTEGCDTGDYAFYVAQNPLDASKRNVVFGVQHDGKIKATKGDIGGWTLGSFTDGATTYTGSLYKDAGDYRIFLRADYSKTSDVAIGVKQYSTSDKSDSGVYKFWVTHEGALKATNANIEGAITATSGSFSRDVTIEGQPLSAWLGDDGNVKKINAESGDIGGWTIAKYESGANTYTGGIYYDRTVGNDIYRSGMKAGGCGASDAAFYVTKNPVGKNANGAEATRENIFYVTHDGSLLATKGKIGEWNIRDGYLYTEYVLGTETHHVCLRPLYLYDAIWGGDDYDGSTYASWTSIIYAANMFADLERRVAALEKK